ncbi:MAG: Ig-like domain-containing protein, partial [Bacteroidales bacterium]|nr:Ig-like domain-containing protein [Bacteroidales bacterium]
MRIHKKIISVVLAFILVFTGLPLQFMLSDDIPYVYAYESTPTVDISFDDFNNTDGLQLNGDSLMEDNAIHFESGVGTGESVFTTDKLTLGEDFSFSTAFSFRNISPYIPIAGTEGGFTFTLQTVVNSVYASDFYDESISPSLSIAFTSDYMEQGATASLIDKTPKLLLASLNGFSLAEGPSARCEISAVPYINGDFNISTSYLPIYGYNVVDEPSEYYNAWIGYDGVEKLLHVFCQAPSGDYTYLTESMNLSEILLTNEVYAGFMGSLGNAGNTSEIGSWYFKNDLSIIHEAIVEAEEAWLTSEMEMIEAEPVGNFYLPLVGQYESTISWVSSNTDVVAEDGTVNPPSLEQGNQIVTLTATIAKGSFQRETRTFIVTIRAADSDIADADYNWLDDSIILNGNDNLNSIVSDLILPTSGDYGSSISWFSDNTDVVDSDGTVIRPHEDRVVTLTAYINMNTAAREKQFNITVKAFGVSDAEIVDADQLWLTGARLLNGNSSLNNVTGNLSLPVLGQYGSTISWASDNTDIVAVNGTVTRPSLAQGDQPVMLTATIRSGEAERQITFTLIVMVRDEDKVLADSEWLTDTVILKGNRSLNNIVSDLNLPVVGNNGSTISWITSDLSVVLANGKVTRPVLGTGNVEVTLMATIRSGAVTDGKYISVTVRAEGNSDDELVAQDKEWLTDIWIKELNYSLSTVTSDLNLRIEGLMGESNISWASSDDSVVATNGTVTRPTYTEGGKSVTLTATFSKGVATPVTKGFTVYVIALEQTPEEKYIEDEGKVNADYEWLDEVIILNGNSALDNITGNLNLPILGNEDSTISWVSTDTGTVNINGTVTRPTFAQGNKTVTLTATIRRGAVTPLAKSFTVVVKALEESAAEKVNADYKWLVDTEILNGNSSLDNVTNNLKLPVEGPNGSTISWASDNAMVVDTEGRITRQSYTHGDQNVMLTATISMGLSVTKTFTVKVIKLEQTAAERDAEKVNADNAWLIETVILKGNSALNNVTGDLNLPTIGENGSEISWTSTDTAFVDAGGIVRRPTYTQGSKSITLTATIKMGLSEVEKPFNITVRANFITNEELVARDYEWLTEEIILNGNSSLDNVTELLYLPTNGMDGIPGSRISWASSHHGFVTIGGNVYRPMYHSGDQTVTLTATISKEAFSMKKIFTVIVKHLDLTDTEAVDETSKWLNRYNILGGNLSSSSVTQDLSFPTAGLYGATVIWSSDNTNIITNGGVVTRPVNRAGNRYVNVTAVVTKGGSQATVTFQYIVLEEPDRTAPAVISTVPANNSMGVLWDTNSIVITYNENIVLAQNHGIELKAAADIQIAARAENKRLIVTPFAALSSGENRLLIPAGIVADAAGNSVEAYSLKFTVEDRPVRNIEVISSSPYDTEKDVAINLDRITIKFDSGNLVKGKYFDTNFTLRTVGKSFFESEFISLPGTLSNDTLTIELNKTLTPATVYEIIVDEGAVQDRFLNKSSSKIIQFRTKGTPPSEIEAPEIASVYPADGQTGVSVNPNIEVALTKVQKLKNYEFKLTDMSGREYPLYAPYTFDLAGTNLIFKPKETLKPNNVYTLSGPYNSVINPYNEEFRTRFTTGSGPQIIKTSPATGDFKAPTRGIVQVYFDVPVTKGFNFNNIRFEDCIGRPVEFVGEETENKAVLRAVTELERHIPYTIYFPSGAYKNAAGVASGQNKITFVATEESLPTELGLQHLDIPDTGFVGKALRISIDNNEMLSWVNYVRSLGYTPISYEWRIDGELADTGGLFYKTFSSPGEKEITLTIKDKYGYTYSTKKTVEIKALQQVRMSLKDSGIVKQINTSEEGAQPSLDFELRLEQESQFIYGENIKVKLYKGGVLQPLSKYNDGVIYITSKYSDNAYKYTYTPKYGDAGTYELVFTYNGSEGEQVIRQPFIVTSKAPAVTEVLRFRLYADKSASYYEELNYVYVMLNGERIRANKEMYTYNGSTFPVYALRKTLQTSTYYDFKVEDWWGNRDHVPFYLGKDNDNPVILSGRRSTTGTAMQVRNITINNSESDLKDYNDIYFEGLSTKLVYNVEGDWGTRDTGYYEIAIINFDKKDSGYGNKEYQGIFKQNHDNKTKLQKIAVKPGVQLKGVSEQYLVRMVSPQGYKSPWMLCPNVSRLSMPEIMGKKLNISVQDGEYAVNWPTVFDGPIGGTIDALNGIPVIGGGNFGIGGEMPNFEGEVLPNGSIELSFEAKGGYGESNKTSTTTKLKKVKKVAVVGYEFEIELEGGITLDYNWYTDEWVVWYFYIALDGDITKKWDKGYELLGVGFTAGVSVGTGVSGALIIKEEDGTKYSGYIGLSPHAGLHVDGDFAVASVKGELTAKIPAEIHFPTGYIGAGINVDASIKAKALLWEKTLYEKELYKVHWDNGKEKVTLKSLLRPAEEAGSREAAEPQLMARDYLNRQSNWLGGNDSGIMRSFGLMGIKTETNPKAEDMMENIFPEAEVKLVVIGEQQWLVWADDNPFRDEINRTQLRYSVLKEGTWSEPGWIGDDGTADFDPVVAAAGDGVLMAWHNIGKILTEEEGLGEMLKSSEISVTESVYSTDGSQPGIINLTEDDKLDHSPRLVADGDRALLVWTKSEGSGLILNMEEGTPSMAGDQLYFSLW